MPLTAFFIISLATLENIAPFIIRYLKTPPGYVFLGTVHHPADYFYYLSQFAQGRYRWITTIDLYTSEAIPPTFVGWSNVLTGRLFHLLGLSPFVAYHASVVILTIVLFIAAYKLCLLILDSRSSATLALYLFALFHAFPVMREGALSYGDYWNNFAVPRVRFGGVPHQLLLSLASIVLVHFAIQRKYIGIALSSLVLSSLQPVLWLILTAALTLTRGLPALVAFVSGLPSVFYLFNLFNTLPFSQLKAWEAAQQTPLTFEHFLASTGPVFLIALFSLPAFLAKKTFSHVLPILVTLFSMLLFLSPVPRALAVSHVRFMSTLTILFLSVIAAHGLVRMNYCMLVLFLMTALLLPNHGKTLELASSFDPGNAFHYLPKAEYDRLEALGITMAPGESVTLPPPYNTIFPAVTGKGSTDGHPLLTVGK